MKRVSVVLAVLVAACTWTGSSAAGEYSVDIGVGEVSSLVLDGESVAVVSLPIPESIMARQLLQGHLELRVGPESTEDAFEIKEVQVAELINGSIVLPAGKARPLSVLCLNPDAASIVLDIGPILEPRFGAQGEAASVTLVIGDLSPEDGLGTRAIVPCRPEEGIWCRLSLKYEG